MSKAWRAHKEKKKKVKINMSLAREREGALFSTKIGPKAMWYRTGIPLSGKPQMLPPAENGVQGCL